MIEDTIMEFFTTQYKFNEATVKREDLMMKKIECLQEELCSMSTALEGLNKAFILLSDKLKENWERIITLHEEES